LVGRDLIVRLLANLGIEDAVSAAQAGLAAAWRIEGKSESRPEIRQALFDRSAGESRVAREKNTRGRIGENRGLLAETDLREFVIEIDEGEIRIPAQAEVQGQAWRDFPVILHEKRV